MSFTQLGYTVTFMLIFWKNKTLYTITNYTNWWLKRLSNTKALIANVKCNEKQQALYKMIKKISLIKSMIAVESTFSNNSLSEQHVKYFSRTCFRLQHSSRICLTVREHLHLLQSGWLSPESRYLWVTRVWPMRSLLRITASRRERCVTLQ